MKNDMLNHYSDCNRHGGVDLVVPVKTISSE